MAFLRMCYIYSDFRGFILCPSNHEVGSLYVSPATHFHWLHAIPLKTIMGARVLRAAADVITMGSAEVFG